jgi:hypothetical protein
MWRIMPNKISADDLSQIFEKWIILGLPPEAKERFKEYVLKATEKIGDMVFLMGQFDTETAFELGNKTSQIVGHPFILCYFIGYEYASGNIARNHLDSYLIAATEPVETFVLEIFKYLLDQGLTSPDDGKKMSLETAKVIGSVATEICVLGVENFKKLHLDE